MSEESFVYTACPGWGDHDYCALKTIVKDGRILRTERVQYSEPEDYDGHICQKGLAAGRQPYNPDRLLYPLKRDGKRGEGKWKRISWDQALDEIAEKMLKIREEHGPQAVAAWFFNAGTPPMGGLLNILAARFSGLWGMTEPVMGMGLDNGPFYSMFYTFGSYNYMMFDPAIFDPADFIIVWGANPIENQMRITQHLVNAREKGTPIVDVGLVFDGTAGFADWFIGIKPGSDGFLALAMANYLIAHDLHDRAFLMNYTVAPYLVRDDNGALLRDAEGNCRIWDNNTGAPRSVATGASLGTDDAALCGAFTVDGVACRPAFELLEAHLSSYTLEAAEELCGVAVADIIKLTEDYAKAENAYLIAALGLRYRNAGETYRALYLLGALTGNYGRPGAGVTENLGPCSYPIVLNDAPILQPNGPEGDMAKHIKVKEFFDEALSGDESPYKAFIVTSGNPVHQVPNRKRWMQLFDRMELVVDIDIWMTDTGELADYVLPDCMPFECNNIISWGMYNHVLYQDAAIEPQGEAKPHVWYWSELAKRVGLGEYFTMTEDEYNEIRLQTEYPLIKDLDPPLTLERLKKEKMVRTLAPEYPKFDPYAGLQFTSPTGKLEFYAERLVPMDCALPKYMPVAECPVIDGNEAFPYQLFTGRQRFFMQSMYTDDPLMVELSGGEPAARMNPRDAAHEGLKDGDKVEVYNDRGHVIVKLRIDEAIPPGTVQVWFGWRKRQYEEGTYAELTVPASSDEVVDELAEHWWNDWLATGKKPANTILDFEGFETGSWDTFWDVACAVRLVGTGKEA
jgi:molybdopterin-containing oxidoreductase family molybdopterin binding subunit